MVKVLRSLVRGPLEAYVGGFAEHLLGRGYTRAGAEQHVCFIAHLDRWMHAEGVGLGGLSGSVIEQYLAQRRAAGYVEYRSERALRPLLDYLMPLGVLPVPAQVPLAPVEELLGRYRDYLLLERGVTLGTAGGYVDCVRGFVASRMSGETLELASLTAADVIAFVLASCPGRAVGSAKLIVCALRSLLGWLHVTGQVRYRWSRWFRRWRAGGCPVCRRAWSLISCTRKNPTNQRSARPLPTTRQPSHLARSPLIMPTSPARSPPRPANSTTTST